MSNNACEQIKSKQNRAESINIKGGEREREGKHKIYSGSVSTQTYVHSSKLPLEYFHYLSNRFTLANLLGTCKTFATKILFQKSQKANPPKQPLSWCYQVSQVSLSNTHNEAHGYNNPSQMICRKKCAKHFVQ
ncbi:unnamed protein product [Camellia sinensis]